MVKYMQTHKVKPCTLFLFSSLCLFQDRSPFYLGVCCIWNIHGEVSREGLDMLSSLTGGQECARSTYGCTAFESSEDDWMKTFWMSKAFPRRLLENKVIFDDSIEVANYDILKKKRN